jgi:hypothetical protein
MHREGGVRGEHRILPAGILENSEPPAGSIVASSSPPRLAREVSVLFTTRALGINLIESHNSHYAVQVASFPTAQDGGLGAAELHNAEVGHEQQVQPGMFIVKVRGVDMAGRSHPEVVSILGSESERPVQIVFGLDDVTFYWSSEASRWVHQSPIAVPRSAPPLPPAGMEGQAKTPLPATLVEEQLWRGLTPEQSAEMLACDSPVRGRLPNIGVPVGSSSKSRCANKKGFCGELQENCLSSHTDIECVIA